MANNNCKECDNRLCGIKRLSSKANTSSTVVGVSKQGPYQFLFPIINVSLLFNIDPFNGLTPLLPYEGYDTLTMGNDVTQYPPITVPVFYPSSLYDVSDIFYIPSPGTYAVSVHAFFGISPTGTTKITLEVNGVLEEAPFCYGLPLLIQGVRYVTFNQSGNYIRLLGTTGLSPPAVVVPYVTIVRITEPIGAQMEFVSLTGTSAYTILYGNIIDFPFLDLGLP